MDVYSPDDIIINYGGFSIEGFAKGSFVKVARNEDDATLSVGADGESTLVLNKNDSAKVTLSLKKSSQSNDVLSSFRALMKAGGGAGIKPLIIKDLHGSTFHHAENCWVAKLADTDYSNEDTNAEWVLETDRMESFVGGAT